MKKTLIILAVKSTKLLKIFKSLKILKAGISFVSMAIFAACYSSMMGVWLAVAFSVLLLLHELGHVIALRRIGHPFKLPLFIPFVGAVIFAERMKTRGKEAFVGIGGPLWGTLAAVAAGIPYLFTHQDIWLVAMYLGIILNMFNMLPISPLDGGRITQAADERLKWLGIAGLLWLTIASKEPGNLLIWMVVVIDFESMRFQKRLLYCVTIWLAMLSMTAAGLGEHHVANWCDVGFGAIIAMPALVAVSIPKFQHKLKEAEEAEAAERKANYRRKLPMRQRWFWLFCWLILLLFQFLILHALTPFLKHP